jgi:DNA polymerase III delta prime subunit
MNSSDNQIFPRELLEESSDKRYAYFQKVKINHKLLDDAIQAVFQAIRNADRDSLIFGYGPPGVGKTTLADLVVAKIIQLHLQSLKIDCQWIPAGRFQLEAPPSGSYRWEDAFRVAMVSMGEPLVEFKLPPRSAEEFTSYPKVFERSDVRRYYRAYLNMLKFRHPELVLFDDAQYLGRVSSKKLTNQMDVAKCLAYESNTRHGFIGTYELLALRNLSGQISRRSTMDVHFRRYRNEKSDRVFFGKAIRTFEAYIPVELRPELEVHLDELMEGSVGCVGNLKKWMERALNLALNDGGRQLTIEHMRSSAWSEAQLSKMFAETLAGEDELKQDRERYRSLRDQMWKPAVEGEPPAPPEVQIHKKHMPGELKPRRLPIGPTGQFPPG